MAGRPAPGRQSASRRTAKQQSQGAPLHPKPGNGQMGKGESAQSQEMAAYLRGDLLPQQLRARRRPAGHNSPTRTTLSHLLGHHYWPSYSPHFGPMPTLTCPLPAALHRTTPRRPALVPGRHRSPTTRTRARARAARLLSQRARALQSRIEIMVYCELFIEYIIF